MQATLKGQILPFPGRSGPGATYGLDAPEVCFLSGLSWPSKRWGLGLPHGKVLISSGSFGNTMQDNNFTDLFTFFPIQLFLNGQTYSSTAPSRGVNYTSKLRCFLYVVPSQTTPIGCGDSLVVEWKLHIVRDQSSPPSQFAEGILKIFLIGKGFWEFR